MPNTDSGQVVQSEDRKTELLAYFDQCVNHDWFYAMSDDNRCFQAGNAQRAQLLSGAKADPQKGSIYDAWRAYIFEGERRPEISDFVLSEDRLAELLDFYHRCENHQWFYFVLEGQAYCTAQEERNALVAEADKDQDKQAIFLLWKKHMFEKDFPRPNPPSQ